jgi:hypothetical protein
VYAGLKQEPVTTCDNLPFVDPLDKLISDDFDNMLDWCIYAANRHCLVHNTMIAVPFPCSFAPMHPDYEYLCPYFGWLPIDIVRQTFDKISQYACMPMRT